MTTARFISVAYKTLLVLFLSFVILLFSCFPQKYMLSTLDGVKVWAICVLPASLPFIFLTACLTATGVASKLSKRLAPVTDKLFSLSGVSAYCLVISFLSGYPVGAKTVSDLYQQNAIDESESTRIGILSSTSSPIFVLGSVGVGMFNDGKTGVILLISHFLGTLLTGVLMRFFSRKNHAVHTAAITRKTESALYDKMLSSVLAVLVVGGFVSVFYTLSAVLSDWYILSPLVNTLTLLGMNADSAEIFSAGLVEMTNGCKRLAENPTVLNICLTEFLITFGGVSIIFQQLAFLKKAEVNGGVFLLGKLVASALSTAVCFFVLTVFGA